MIPCGPIISELTTQCNQPRGTNDAIWEAQVKEKLNEAYRDVCGVFPWSLLQAVVTLADSVYRLPGDCNRVLRVSDDDKVPYNFVAGKSRDSHFNKNWYFAPSVSTALASGTTVAGSEYGTAVTSTAEFPATTCVDEWIRIGSNTGVYKISAWTSTSAITLQDNFRGDAIDAGRFQIRPKGTLVLAFADSVGDALTPTGVELTYIRNPLPLYDDSDMIELPGNAPAVKIKALQKLLAMLGFSSAADKMQSQYMSALAEMKTTEPRIPIVAPTSMFRREGTSGESFSYIRGLSLINQG
jgi:hypothetical protein